MGAYITLEKKYNGQVVGIDEKNYRVKQHIQNGINCICGDANDYEFWNQSNLIECDKIFVCLSNHKENMYIVKLAQEMGYNNVLAVVSQFADEQKELEDNGCITFNLFAEAGSGFAEHVLTELEIK